MGNLIDKRIVQARAYNDPNELPIPDKDYYYTYPISLFEAVKKTDAADSSNLNDEFDAIITRLMLKQNLIGANTNGAIITYTGQDGVTGIRPVVHSINSVAALRSNSNIPTEQAVGSLGDTKANSADLINHKSDKNVHMTSEEKLRWNMMTPLSVFQAHESDGNIHTSAAEKILWNNKANNNDFMLHVNNHNNPHVVTASQINTYTKPEIDNKLLSMQTKFFNYLNIVWDEQAGTVTLEKYNSTNWDPNYILTYDERLPEIDDPSHTYFALSPATDYLINQTNDIIIYIKKPEMVWVEAGRQTLQPGDLVVRYPDTGMFLWIGGRFVEIITRNADESGGDTPSDYEIPDGSITIPKLATDTIDYIESMKYTVEPMPSYTVKGNNTDGDALPANVSYEDLLTKLLNMINPESIADLLKPYLNINSGTSGDKDILGKRWIRSNFVGSGVHQNIVNTRTYHFKGVWILYNHPNGIQYSTGGRYWMPTNIKDNLIIHCYENNGVLYALEDDISSSGETQQLFSPIFYYSTDGKYWNIYSNQGGYNIIYKNGLWLSGITPLKTPIFSRAMEPSINNNRYTGIGIRYSNDGINWYNSNVTTGVIDELYYYYNKWIITVIDKDEDFDENYVTVYYSYDGETWNKSITVPNRDNLSIFNSNGILFISDLDNFTNFSFDGVNWINSGYRFNYCICKDNIWIARSYSGLYYSTNNGNSWNQTIPGEIQYIAHNNNMWVAVGKKTIYYSTNGIDWTSTSATPGGSTYEYFGNIEYGGGIWIVPGYQKLCYSNNGIDWSDSTSAVNNSNSLNSINYDNGIWVINTDNGLYYSTDGNNWINSNTTVSSYSTIQYGRNIWIVNDNYYNKLFYSIDGMVWTECNIPEGIPLDSVYYRNNIWYNVVYDRLTELATLCWSNDGINWNKSDISGEGINIDENSNVIYVMAQGLLRSYYSFSGDTYNIGPTINIMGAQYYYPANGIVLSWGDTGIKHSIDGVTFHETNITDSVLGCWEEHGVWGAVAVELTGDPDLRSVPLVKCYTSSDGILWHQMNFMTLPQFMLELADFGAVLNYYKDGKWIKADLGGMMNSGGPAPNYLDDTGTEEMKYYYSDNGIDWEPINWPTGDSTSINYIYYANDLWVASLFTPDDGYLLTTVCYSEDGTNWIKSNMGNDESSTIDDVLQYCLYANGIWVAACDQGMYYSTDGKIWKPTIMEYNDLIGEVKGFYKCYYIDDSSTWICNGNDRVNEGDYVNAYTEMYYSHDGKTWHHIIERPIDTKCQIISYDMHDGVIVACCTTGVYFSSGNEWYVQDRVAE